MTGFDFDEMNRWIFWSVAAGLLTPIVIVAMVMLGVRSAAKKAQKTPHEILEERFANGEISPEEYRARRSALDDEG